ncbi:uncharacterized protein LOC132244868 [Alligator mississippiensis]|uniref:uncharacterized protein LOC132244868 n=1 Tax=Alligator mississippiensis TaxID=8496 RepID=UPI002877D799|nr:uncharacterized protein LOC132244868 [Alligator mississippiensis]
MWALVYLLKLLSLLGISNPAIMPTCCKCPQNGGGTLTEANYKLSKSTILSALLHPISRCCPCREIIIQSGDTTPLCVKPDPEIWSAILKDWPSSLQPVNNIWEPKGTPTNTWVGNSWVALLKDSARALTNESCLLCALTPVSSDERVPFLPIPLNRTGIVSDWGFNRNFSLRYNGSGRIMVAKVTGSICISQHGSGFKVGQSRCKETWISKEIAPWEGAWTCANVSYNNFDNCNCLLSKEWISVWGINCTHYRNGTKVNGSSTKRSSLTLTLKSSRSTITNEACGLWWICGRWAYKQLPANWAETCYLGALIPGVWITQPKTHRAKQNTDVSFKDITAGGAF